MDDPPRARIEAPACALWWGAIEDRLEEVRSTIPPSLCGVVQIEVEIPERDAAHFHLVVAGPNTRAIQGSAAQPDAVVRTSDAELAILLVMPEPDALRVYGDAELVRALFHALDRPIGHAFEMRRGA